MKFRTLSSIVYFAGVTGGLVVGIIGIAYHHRGLAKIGLGIALVTGIAFSIPLLVGILLGFFNKTRTILKRGPK